LKEARKAAPVWARAWSVLSGENSLFSRKTVAEATLNFWLVSHNSSDDGSFVADFGRGSKAFSARISSAAHTLT
jgi:hypothetical protein